MSVIVSKFVERSRQAQSLLCVGLDPEIEKIPARFHSAELPLFEFCRWVIEQTREFAVAYKPNAAFFEARGALGMRELEAVAAYLREHCAEAVSICDAKRADIGSTNRGYVQAIFDSMGFDAVTLHPYLGREALAPFLQREDKACIILCRTSNPGAGEFQDLVVSQSSQAAQPLWERVAQQVSAEWNAHGNCMLVVGATYPDEMRRIRAVAPQLPMLVPGIGAQGGDVQAVVSAGLDAHGGGLLISASRSIQYAASPSDAARQLRDEIERAREVCCAR